MAQSVHAVGILYENPDGEILVLRRSANAPEPGTWGTVGGKVDPGEEADQAAARESAEEIGYAPPLASLEHVRNFHWDRDDLDLAFDVFRAAWPESTTITLEAKTFEDYMWAKPDDLYARPDLMKGLYPILEAVYGVSPQV